MEYTVIVELSILLQAVMLGAGLSAGYVLVRSVLTIIVKKKYKKYERIQNLSDILFGMVVAVSVFFLLYTANGGVMRIFIVGSVFLSMLITKKMLQLCVKTIMIVTKCKKMKRERRKEL